MPTMCHAVVACCQCTVLYCTVLYCRARGTTDGGMTYVCILASGTRGASSRDGNPSLLGLHRWACPYPPFRYRVPCRFQVPGSQDGLSSKLFRRAAYVFQRGNVWYSHDGSAAGEGNGARANDALRRRAAAGGGIMNDVGGETGAQEHGGALWSQAAAANQGASVVASRCTAPGL